MDLNDLRMAVTLLAFVAFVGIAAWAWSRRQEARFDEAAQLPFVAEGLAMAEGPAVPEEKAVADAYPHRRGYRAKQLPKQLPERLPRQLP